MPEIKWWRPEDIQSVLITHLLLPPFDQNGSSKDYSCVPEEFLFFPASLTQRFQTAHSVEKTGMKLMLECVVQP